MSSVRKPQDIRMTTLLFHIHLIRCLQSLDIDPRLGLSDDWEMNSHQEGNKIILEVTKKGGA